MGLQSAEYLPLNKPEKMVHMQFVFCGTEAKEGILVVSHSILWKDPRWENSYSLAAASILQIPLELTPAELQCVTLCASIPIVELP